MRFFPHIQIFSRLYNLPPRQAFWSSRRPDSLAITVNREMGGGGGGGGGGIKRLEWAYYRGGVTERIL